VGAAPDQVVDQCPFEPVVDLVLGRWTSHMLWTLATEGRLRFSELHAQLPAVTPRVLTEASYPAAGPPSCGTESQLRTQIFCVRACAAAAHLITGHRR